MRDWAGRLLRLNLRRLRRPVIAGCAVVLAASVIIAVQTIIGLAPPESLSPTTEYQSRIVARDGTDLSLSYLDPWNVQDRIAYHEVPELLRQAFLVAEDQRFFSHRGVDWIARAHAVFQAVRAGRFVRGASTISEQVVRILNPRPRTLWSRWLEEIEARIMERRFSKTQILECYLNQVPYASNRRGIVQAARTYFDRDLDTLNPHEMLALAVLVRSPSRLDLDRGSDKIRVPLEILARRLHEHELLDAAEYDSILDAPLAVVKSQLEVEAAHFVRFARYSHVNSIVPAGHPSVLMTTLDPSMQARVQKILDRQVEDLATRGVADGAALVVDHRSDEILAWAGAFGFSERPGGQIDKVTTARQPGSTLKPFLYALALERGWTAATIVDDSPLTDVVGHGLHAYRNYSRHFYGPIRLREALGNSLNIPAVRAARSVGGDRFLTRLRALGLNSLSQDADYYGDGLALGNGEVTLYELVRAYAVLARGGVYRPIRWRLGEESGADSSRRVFDPEVSSLIANILSDPAARRREFGENSVLNLPIQTAVKTGTSNDHRDAWAVGFSHGFTVGVWMGNIDGRPTEEVSGSQGPAMVLRAVFAELHRHAESKPLYFNRTLNRRTICTTTGRLAGSSCPTTAEWFRKAAVPTVRCRLHQPDGETSHPGALQMAAVPRLASPVSGLHIAKDPRIPDNLELFPLRLVDGSSARRTEWLIDGQVEGETGSEVDSWFWPVKRGRHTAQARVWSAVGTEPAVTESVEFLVK